MIRRFFKDSKEKLSKDFSIEEFHCHCQFQECFETYIDEGLVNGLQILRNVIAVPVVITRGYSCSAHNKAVGGAKNSFHLLGMAADLYAKGVGLNQLIKAASQIDAFGGIGSYQGHLHVDTGPRRDWASQNL